MKISIFIISTLFAITACNKSVKELPVDKLINTAHLDHLYEEIRVDGVPAAIIHIYAEYPDYKWTYVDHEGVGCMDDVARAAVFYFRQAEQTGNKEYERKAGLLLNFVTQLQDENGYFYNFTDAEFNILKNTVNSAAVGDWWSWRALWAISEAEKYYMKRQPDKAASLRKRVEMIIPNISKLLEAYPETEEHAGFKVPTWLPLKFGADQASVIILALAPYGKRYPDDRINRIVRQMAEGIALMQVLDKKSPAYGAFMSWKNVWHAWGNCQADAMLFAADLLEEENFKEAALREIDHFYENQLKEGQHYLIEMEKTDTGVSIIDKREYEQISYGIRPMVMASMHAYELYGDEKHLQNATDLAKWLGTGNPLRERMYDPSTGRCFDGINSPTKKNLNSGAESTVEALLILQAIEKHNQSRDQLLVHFNTGK